MHKSCLNCDKRNVCKFLLDINKCKNMTATDAIFEFTNELEMLVAKYCIFYGKNK